MSLTEIITYKEVIHRIQNIFIFIVLLSMASCKSYKEVAYFQNAEETESYSLTDSLRTLRIMPKDILQFAVSGVAVPEAASAYNIVSISALRGQDLTYGVNLMDYPVENDGTVNLVRVGKIHVVGKTLEEIERDVAHAIADDFVEQPIVTARLKSYKVTIMGESNTRGVLEMTSQRSMNILEALTQNGDLTLYGKRANVMVIREGVDGEKTYYRVNLKDKNIINNPGYYLRQNDIVYVEPNEVRKKDLYAGDSTNFAISLVSICTSLAALLIRLF